MKRILKNEIGRCKHCGSSVVISPFRVGHGKNDVLSMEEHVVTKNAAIGQPVQTPKKKQSLLLRIGAY